METQQAVKVIVATGVLHNIARALRLDISEDTTLDNVEEILCDPCD